MGKEVEISSSTKDDISIIKLKGDITAVTGAGIENAYETACKNGAKKIVFCFSGDDYINSGGIAILIGIVAAGRNSGQKIRFTGLSSHFQKIFGMVGLTKYAEIFQSEESALKDF